MKLIHVILAIWLASLLQAFCQPAPILRSAWTTNVAGTPIKSVNDASVTNFSGSLTHTQWDFWGIGPRTVARLIDVSNIVAIASGSATNAVSTIQSNGIVISTGTTNLNFVDSPFLTWLLTNNPMGLVSISALVSGGSGETNYNGEVFTNTTLIGWVFDKLNNTNRLRSFSGGNGIVLTNNGTNVVSAIDPAVVASQTDLNASSNVLRTDINLKQTGSQVLSNLVGTVANNVTNVVSLSTSNSLSKPITNSYANGVLTLRGIQAGSSIGIIENGSNYVFSWSGIPIFTNAIAVSGGAISLTFSANSGNTILATNIGGSVFINYGPDWLITASQTNLNSASNFLYGLASSGSLRIQTNQTAVGTETNLNFVAGNGLIQRGTNVAGTNTIAFAVSNTVTVDTLIVSNKFGLINFNPQIGSVWTCTNATTGEGYWSTNRGFKLLSVHSALFPAPPVAGLDTGTNNTWRLLFDDGTNEVVYFQVPLDDNYYTNANILIHYSTLAAAANTSNVWEVAVMVVPGIGGKTINTDTYNGAVEITNQVQSTAGYLNKIMWSCNATSAIAGDLLKLRLTRKGTNSFDNASGDAAVHAITFEYHEKKGI